MAFGCWTTHLVRLASLLYMANDGLSNALSIFIFWPWGLTPGPKFIQLGGDLQQAPFRHPAKFQPDRQYGLRDVHYQNFQFLALWLSLGQCSPKRTMTCYLSRSTILPNFIALRQPTPEISVTKYLRTSKQSYKQ